MSSDVFLQVVINGLMLGSLYVLTATGLTLIFGIMNIVNFSHGAIFMLGGYLTYLFAAQLGLNFAAGLVFSVIIVAMFGVLSERFLFRPVREQHLSGIIVSLGMALCLEVFVLVVFGTREKTLDFISGVVKIFGAVVSVQRLVIIPIALVMVLFLILYLRYSKSGQSLVAVSQDRKGAALMGIDIDRASGLCMAIGFGMAAVAGSLWAPVFLLNPYMGAPIVGKSFAVIIFGGLGSIPGAILGGLILGMIESFGGTLLTSELAPTFGFLVMFLVLVFRPRGLFGRAA